MNTPTTPAPQERPESLPAKWRLAAGVCEVDSLHADSIGLYESAKTSDACAKVLDACANELEAALAALQRPEGEPANLGEYVIALLIAAGYVTQAKCDEARAIALGIDKGPLAAPPAPEVSEAAFREGWLACRREVFGLCEHTTDAEHPPAVNDHENGYRRGAKHEAKSIARAMGAIDYTDAFAAFARGRGGA